jgi:Sulfotransferase family
MRAPEIVQKARDQAGLEQFDSDTFREGLEIAAAAVDAHQSRTAQGRAFVETIYVNALANRLRVAEYARQHPEIRRARIEKPIFIMGMPRTGTTLASYLLGADPNFRSLLRWEVATPVPPPTTARLKTDPRCLALQEQDAQGDPFAYIHYEAPDGPTECTFVMVGDFKSLFVESLSCSPVYSKWILGADLTSAYEYHRLFLQVLQSQAPGTWALKLPSHALGIRVLMKMYPDARIIWTHRDPFKAVGSLISMISNVHRIGLERPDIDYLAGNYPNQLAEHVRRPMAVQDELQRDPFYHLYYNELVRDPLGQMRKLYTWLGESLRPQALAAMQSWLAANPQGRFGKHAYGLEEFGLSKAKLLPYFADYLQRFDIEPEG